MLRVESDIWDGVTKRRKNARESEMGWKLIRVKGQKCANVVAVRPLGEHFGWVIDDENAVMMFNVQLLLSK